MKPIDAIKKALVRQRFYQPVKNYKEKLIDVGTKVRYLYEPTAICMEAEENEDLLPLYGQ